MDDFLNDVFTVVSTALATAVLAMLVLGVGLAWGQAKPAVPHCMDCEIREASR